MSSSNLLSSTAAAAAATGADSVQHDAASAYQRLTGLLKEVEQLEHISGILEWDSEVMLPPAAVDARAQQLALIARLRHEKCTQPELGELLELLDACDDDELTPWQWANVREARDQFVRNSRLSVELREREAKLASTGYNAWVQACKQNDFSVLAPVMQEWVDLLREKASRLLVDQPNSVPYDACLQSYDRGTTTASVAAVFNSVKTQVMALLKVLIPAQQALATAFDDSWLGRVDGATLDSDGPVSKPLSTFDFDQTKVEQLSCIIATNMGFDWSKGRLDASAHPFTSEAHSTDVRITIKKGEDIVSTLLTVLHEVGHALYEQARREDQRELPAGGAVSAAVHESQALFWEKMIGQSEEFWEFCLPLIRSLFPALGPAKTARDVYRAVNKIRNSLVRLQSDDVTYPLHIIMRFELESALINGEITVAELPAKWNEKSLEYFGAAPRNDKEGILQDVHWSQGLIGYFPGYLLGTIMCSQFERAMFNEQPNMYKEVATGNFAPLRQWLNRRVHSVGSLFPTGEKLLKQVCGSGVSVETWMRFITRRYYDVFSPLLVRSFENDRWLLRRKSDEESPSAGSLAGPREASLSSDPSLNAMLIASRAMSTELLGYMSKIRNHLHAHPELSNEEHNTSKMIVDELRKIPGVTNIRTGIAGTGITAEIRGLLRVRNSVRGNKKRPPAILLRADMDALPLQDIKPASCPYRSTVEGVCHACGHDAHVAILLGTAHILAHQRANFHGKVLLVFQPAEETIGGARQMVIEGAIGPFISATGSNPLSASTSMLPSLLNKNDTASSTSSTSDASSTTDVAQPNEPISDMSTLMTPQDSSTSSSPMPAAAIEAGMPTVSQPIMPVRLGVGRSQISLEMPGALRVENAGAYRHLGAVISPTVDLAVALHVMTAVQVGKIGVRNGPMYASEDNFTITVRGFGGHASNPHLAVNPVLVAANIVVSLNAHMPQLVDPTDKVVLSITGLHGGGEAHNVISDECVITGTMRAHNELLRDRLCERVANFVRGTAALYSAQADVLLQRGFSCGRNHELCADLVRAVSRRLFGAASVVELAEPEMGSEDFYEFPTLGRIPGVMFWLGCANENKGIVVDNHNGGFDIDHNCLSMGAALLAGCAARFFHKPQHVLQD